MKCKEITKILETLSPIEYACDWDNVGLLVGRKDKEIKKIVIALDASEEVISIAVKEQADLLITHHPMIFSSIKKVNGEQFTTAKVLTLAEYGICYYAMHTNFDTVGGMAELAAGEQYLNLSDTSPIESDRCSDAGMGRYGRLPKPMTAEQVAEYVKKRFDLPYVLLYQRSDEREKIYDRIAVMPGSGKSEIARVKEKGYSLYLTGDIGHHEGLDAMDMGISVIDATHYGLEHIFIPYLYDYLKTMLKDEKLDIVTVDTGCPAKVL